MIDRCVSTMFCCALLLISSSSGLHASCADTPQGEGHVSAVLDGRTFRLDDGREVRLAGIELPRETTPLSIDALASLIGGREVAMYGSDDRPDRYGRQPAFVVAKGSATLLQSELLAGGAVLASGTVTGQACLDVLFAAEATARAARRGIWASSTALKNAESPDDILAGTGQFAVVEGTISSARLAGATFYVNFGRRWTRDFAVTISRRMMPSFEIAGIDLKSLKDKRVRVRGWIERRGGPRIEATHPGQIELVAADPVSRSGSTARNFVPEREDK